jgi:putative membrane protein
MVADWEGVFGFIGVARLQASEYSYFCRMDFQYLRALHIVFIVSWFAALFYIVRLFIYATEAQRREEPARGILTAQLQLMQRRLWNVIGWPAMAGTYIFGSWLLAKQWEYYLSQPWMWLKLIAVLLLTVYHLRCTFILREQGRGEFRLTSLKLRLFNELATVFLVAIVFLVVVKSTSGLLWGTLGLLAFAGTLMLAVFIYRQYNRKQNGNGRKNEL